MPQPLDSAPTEVLPQGVRRDVRRIVRLVRGRETSDGAGVRLRRLIGGSELPQVDPFLLLDEIRSDDPRAYIAGFPPHPHRGFETVTYLLAGRMRHADSAGHTGVIEAGGVQWMTAGRGIIHSEMPEQEEGLLAGFQLWVNLPAARKMMAPRYQEFGPQGVTQELREEGATVRVIAGTTSRGSRGPVTELVVPILCLDVTLPLGARFTEPLPEGHSLFVYPFTGALAAGEGEIPEGNLALLEGGEAVSLRATRDARLLLVAASPLGEPVARHGPFVMNSEEELRQAYRDYQQGRFGEREGHEAA